jgi:hypothetical protein
MAKSAHHQLDELAEQALAIQFAEAREADAVGYYSRIMCQTSLPISRVPGSEYVKESGPCHLSVMTPQAIGLPYGRYPRGILIWLVTEIVKKHGADDGSRRVYLGRDLGDFMEAVSGSALQSGGETGNIRRFKRQLTSLLMSRIMYWTNEEQRTAFQSMEISPSGQLFWSPPSLTQRGLIQSWIEVGEVFWNDCIGNKVPLDLRVIRGLWDYGCLTLDVYAWLTYRAFVMRRLGRSDLRIPWTALKFQFGVQYSRERKFRETFQAALRRIRLLYTGFETGDWEGKGLCFRFQRPSVIPITGTPGVVLRLRRAAPPTQS